MKNYFKRIFLIVLDSFGIGEMMDSAEFGDKGANTFKSIFMSKNLKIENLKKLGIFNIDLINFGNIENSPIGCYGYSKEKSNGKDTIVGHWEIAGVSSKMPLPTYPNGFPENIIKSFEERCGVKTICNKPYSGTDVLKVYGNEHIRTGALIVYTSADSVFQIAAHQDVVALNKLYEYCQIARGILNGENAVGRVIARPFIGSYPNFTRTADRHDYSLNPPKLTILDYLKLAKYDVIGIGKIYDIFNGNGVTKTYKTKNNSEAMERLDNTLKDDFSGLCFANLVDFDMVYGHRNDINGYAKALNEFDIWLGKFIKKLNNDDLLIITADHGCDPGYPTTDHT
ncbi:MAG: phosphopentomutase, partial [Oscillospiraceae bacterium]